MQKAAEVEGVLNKRVFFTILKVTEDERESQTGTLHSERFTSKEKLEPGTKRPG